MKEKLKRILKNTAIGLFIFCFAFAAAVLPFIDLRDLFNGTFIKNIGGTIGVKERISTIEEAVAFLDENQPMVYMRAQKRNSETDSENCWYLPDGSELLSKLTFESIDRADIVRMVDYLFTDV